MWGSTQRSPGVPAASSTTGAATTWPMQVTATRLRTKASVS